MRSVTIRALLTMLWWVSVAPLGEPVVPDVNWMLIGSSGSRVRATASRRNACAGPPSCRTSLNRKIPGPGSSLIATTILRRGSRADASRPGSQRSSSGASPRIMSR